MIKVGKTMTMVQSQSKMRVYVTQESTEWTGLVFIISGSIVSTATGIFFSYGIAGCVTPYMQCDCYIFRLGT